MTNKEILEKAIEQSENNGFSRESLRDYSLFKLHGHGPRPYEYIKKGLKL